MGDDNNTSVIIIYSFAFLFIVFLFLQQGNFIKEAQTTGYALFDTSAFTNLQSFSLTTLIIIVVALILILIGGYFLYQKIKNKKQSLNAPNPPQYNEKTISNLNKEFNVRGSKKSESEMNNDAIRTLFMEDVNKKEQLKPKTEKPKEIKPNFGELRNILKSLMKKNYTKESIVKYLTSKGYNIMQVKKALNSINQESLANYIKNSLAQGFSKQEIVKALLERGWNKEDILKRIS